MNKVLWLITAFFVLAFLSCSSGRSRSSITWKLYDPENIGGHKTTISGNPFVVKNDTLTCIYFNGKNDGIEVPVIPMEGWPKFTIEAMINPSSSGPVEPRFLHFEDAAQNRGTLEIRITPGKKWYLDAFLKNGATGKGFALIDSTKLHATDQWYWVAMVYDGRTMKSFVNGQQELQKEFSFPVLTGGKLSLGVRLNKVNWFQGKICELRFHRGALIDKRLQRF